MVDHWPCRKEVATKLAPGGESWKPKLKVFSHKKRQTVVGRLKMQFTEKAGDILQKKEGEFDIYICAVSNTNVTKHLGFKNFTQWAHFGRISVESGQCHSTSN